MNLLQIGELTGHSQDYLLSRWNYKPAEGRIKCAQLLLPRQAGEHPLLL